MFVRYWLTFCDAAVLLVLGVGVGEDVVGLVHPAARIAAIITSANDTAKNDFFIVNPRMLLTIMHSMQSSEL